MQLKIDITRRCNLNCKICMRGNAQNQDITPRIIDKIIDEVKDCYISTIQISGGEPFLNPDMFEYLINKIIDNKIAFGSLGIYTNGTIRDEKIKKALSDIVDYLNGISERFSEYIEFHETLEQNEFKQNNAEKVFLIISTHYHDTNNDDTTKTMEYFKSINKDSFCVVKDDGKDFGSMYLSGNAYENYKELLPEHIEVDKYKFTCSQFDFIKNYNYSEYSFNNICDTFLAKTISISTNGNVYCGVSWSYDNIDSLSMFNILRCNNNFVDKVSDWCWYYPVNSKIGALRNKHSISKWFVENGYKIDISEDVLRLLSSITAFTDIHENEARKLHQKYKSLCHTEVDSIISAKMPLILKDRAVSDYLIYLYLKICTIFPDEVLITHDFNAFAVKYISKILDNHSIKLTDVLKLNSFYDYWKG